MSISLRGLTRSDVPAWNRLLADIEDVEKSGEAYNEADLHEEMDNPDLELGQDIVGAFDGDELVGYFAIHPRAASDEIHKVPMEGSVHPARRGEGVGTLLATAMLARARAVHARTHPEVPALYMVGGMSQNTAQADLMAGLGLLPERWTFVMRADLKEVSDPVPFPDGLELRQYDGSMAQLMRETHNVVFRDHPNFTPWTEVMWTQWVTGSRAFRPEHSFVVVDPRRPEQLVAYVQTSEYDAYFESTGRREAYVGKVGTRRDYRGRGIATTLLQHCLKAYQQAGYDEASLDVDSENPTGALEVYRRAGFEVESKRTDYTLRVG
ncbi:MAG TPA: GNAT family N-acetyltransferase [Nocardioidaceae bacterium]|nr:GNAT family N-acetyltransferase [Nocardioidaceae bacterium]